MSLLLLAVAAFGLLGSALAQSVAVAELPDAPQTAPEQGSSPPTPDQSQASAAQSKTPAAQQPAIPQTTPETREQQQQRAQKELKQEEKQRMLGIVPMFNVTSNNTSAPLTPKQKFQLMFKSSTDPYIFVLTAIDGGISQAGDEYASYGQGVEGFAKYWGAAYADTFDGNFWGNAVLPSLLHEDPRYFRMGHGNFFRRAGYSALTTVWCRRDNGKWGPNYGNVAGNFIAGAISNVYYPANDRGVELTFARGASVTYEGVVGAELAEFWPDIAQHYIKKHQQKLERQAAQSDAAPAQPTPAPH